MEPKNPEFNFPTPRANDLHNKGKEEEVTANDGPKKRKISSLSNDSSIGESPQVALDPISAKSNETNFSCKICDEVFSCYRGLNGHQNAHKNKRAFAMDGRNMIVDGLVLASSTYNSNQGYFSNWEPYYKNLKSPTQNFSPPIVPSKFPETYYHKPYFAPNSLGFLGWNGTKVNHPLPYVISQRIPIPNVNHAPINMMTPINSKLCAENGKDQGLGAGRSNSIDHRKRDSQDKSLDLTLKL